MALDPGAAKLVAKDFAAPDLERIRHFIIEAAKKGAIAVLVATLMALLTRRRDLNQELTRRLNWKNRKHPASETMRRLQLELPFVVRLEPEESANDTSRAPTPPR